jgi:16S rRNA (guanine527-N7)-methyltransferase
VELDLDGLLCPYAGTLSSTQREQVSVYLDLLLRWNARMNLTAIREPENIVTRHFGESFFLARQPFVRSYAAIDGAIDVGSGAGFPGIPLKILCPDLTLTLIEAQQRKSVFLREVLRAIELEAEVKNVRVEDLAEHAASSAGLVTLRGVEKFDSILPTAARLVRSSMAGKPPGAIALLIGEGQISTAERVLAKWRFQPQISIPGSQNRVILWGEPS